MNSFNEPRIRLSGNEEPETQPQTATEPESGEKFSGFIWKTFVGNKKKEDFFKSAILLLILLNGILGFLLYTQKTQKAIYVIDDGIPKLASLVGSEVRVDEQITFFVKLWTKLLLEVNSGNYQQNRDFLKELSGQNLMKRVLTSESAAGNRLFKEVIQTETMRLKVVDVIIEEIQRQGSMINVTFSDVIQIDHPDGSERYVTNHKAEIIAASYGLNGVGLAMIDMDGLWKLERRLD